MEVVPASPGFTYSKLLYRRRNRVSWSGNVLHTLSTQIRFYPFLSPFLYATNRLFLLSFSRKSLALLAVWWDPSFSLFISSSSKRRIIFILVFQKHLRIPGNSTGCFLFPLFSSSLHFIFLREEWFLLFFEKYLCIPFVFLDGFLLPPPPFTSFLSYANNHFL